MPETRTRYHYHPRKRQRTLADCGVAVAKQEAGLNDTSSDLVTRGKERRNPEDEMEAGAPLQEEMITRKVDDQVGNTGGEAWSWNPEEEKATGAPLRWRRIPKRNLEIHYILSRLVTQGGGKVL